MSVLRKPPGTKPCRAIHSALEVVSIAEVESRREELGARCFSVEELATISGRRAQTTAGFLAAKRALVRLFAERKGGQRFEERDFLLTHAPGGAPRIASLPSSLDSGQRVRVSISHTRSYAYGLAVVEGDVGG